LLVGIIAKIADVHSQSIEYLRIEKGGVMDRFVVLSVGDVHKLGLGKDRIIYAGMSSESVFSIIQVRWEFLYRGYSWNLYFPKSRSKIRIDGVNILVENVTPDEIRLRT
jgi:hypothetical protein